MAGFQVSINGRFWVSTEELHPMCLRGLTRGTCETSLRYEDCRVCLSAPLQKMKESRQRIHYLDTDRTLIGFCIPRWS
jgi:hypothetical protein